jgi:hypothetical protein
MNGSSASLPRPGLFLAAYTGLAVPVLGLGLATQSLPARDAVLGFAVALAAVVAAAGWCLLHGTAGRRARTGRRPRPVRLPAGGGT